MNILGVGGLDHNGSITFCKNQRIVSFLEAERPTRQKNIGLINEETLALLLRRLSVKDVAHIGVADQTFWAIRRSWLEPTLANHVSAPVRVWHHHDCHVAAALVASPWERALCISIDGKGDDLSAMAAIVSREHGVEKRIVEVPSAHSLGRLWWAVSEYCGFPGHYSAGKTMALAAFGKPFALFDSISNLHSDGTFSFETPDGHPDTFRQVSRIHDWIIRSLARFGRDPEHSRADVAASLQELSTRVVTHLVQTAVQKAELHHVCIAGGVALNGVTNQHLVEHNIVKDLFVVPCCDDRGLSLGAAALTAALVGKPIRPPVKRFNPFLGPSPTFTKPIGWRPRDGRWHEAAKQIVAGSIVAIFTGRDEAGPRALGNRSLVASPSYPNMRTRLNQLKRREPFRPFGCALDARQAAIWFSTSDDVPFMLRIATATAKGKRDLPAALHVDGTSRLQTVHPDDSSPFWPLFDALEALAHPRALLNTSLNGPGEPLAHSVEDAADIATRLGADFLLIDGELFEPSPGKLHRASSNCSALALPDQV